jgi:hypothetical protein
MFAIRTPDEPAHSPTCVSAPESTGDRTVAEHAVPVPATLDFTNVIANHWKLEHRKKHQVPAAVVMSTRKSREVIDGDVQVPLSWDERFALLHPPQVSVGNVYPPLGWALRIFYISALVVFVSALVRYFHFHHAFIDSHILPACANAWLTISLASMLPPWHTWCPLNRTIFPLLAWNLSQNVATVLLRWTCDGTGAGTSGGAEYVTASTTRAIALLKSYLKFSGRA